MLTNQDKAYLKAQMDKGLSYDDAFKLLKSVKAKVTATTTPTTATAENLTGTAWAKDTPAPEGYKAKSNVWGETGLVKEDLGLGSVIDFATNTAKQGFEGVKNIAGGLYEQGKEMIGADADKNVSGEGFSQAFGGALQLITAPIQAAAKEIPMGEPVLEAVSKILNSPAELGGFLWEKAWETAGKDVNDPAFQQGKRQVVDALGVATMAAAPKVIGKAASGLPKASNFAGKSLKNVANYLEEKVLPTTAKEAELLQKFEANKMIAEEALAAAKKNGDVAKITEAKKSLDSLLASKPRTIAKTSTERGISGTRTGVGLSSAKTGTTIFTKEINPALKATKETITRDELFKPLEDKIADTVEPGRKAELEAALEAIKEEYASPAFDNLTLEVAQKIKSGLDEFTPQKAFKGQEIANGYNQLRAEMANAIRRATYDKLKSQDIKNKYLDYSNLLELQKLGIKARMEKGAGFAPGGLASQIRTIWDMAATPLGTVAGKYLYKLGDLLEFESPIKVKTAGEFIGSQGISKNEFYNQINSSYERTGGVTVNLQGDVPKKGYAFAPSKDSEFKIKTDAFEENRDSFVAQFLSKNKDTLNKPGAHFGLWRSDDGFVYIDISQVVADLAQAKKAAKASNQLAIYDLEKNEAISLD